MHMKTLNERIVDLSAHLQSLATPRFSSAIEEAVERNDKESLIRICRKANIPKRYVGTVVSVISSVAPQKWPIEL
jgi:hypothetical protein